MRKPSAKQIKSEIDWLKSNKSKIRRFDCFGGDNWEKLEQDLKVLENDMDQDEIDAIEDDDLRGTAQETYNWMKGDEDISPSQNWQPLVK